MSENNTYIIDRVEYKLLPEYKWKHWKAIIKMLVELGISDFAIFSELTAIAAIAGKIAEGDQLTQLLSLILVDGEGNQASITDFSEKEFNDVFRAIQDFLSPRLAVIANTIKQLQATKPN